MLCQTQAGWLWRPALPLEAGLSLVYAFFPFLGFMPPCQPALPSAHTLCESLLIFLCTCHLHGHHTYQVFCRSRKVNWQQPCPSLQISEYHFVTCSLAKVCHDFSEPLAHFNEAPVGQKVIRKSLRVPYQPKLQPEMTPSPRDTPGPKMGTVQQPWCPSPTPSFEIGTWWMPEGSLPNKFRISHEKAD